MYRAAILCNSCSGFLIKTHFPVVEKELNVLHFIFCALALKFSKKNQNNCVYVWFCFKQKVCTMTWQ